MRKIFRLVFGVYPRPRGGTCAPERYGLTPMGLSPPTRGNQRQMRRIDAEARSIPAHAGEPGRALSAS